MFIAYMNIMGLSGIFVGTLVIILGCFLKLDRQVLIRVGVIIVIASGGAYGISLYEVSHNVHYFSTNGPVEPILSISAVGLAK